MGPVRQAIDGEFERYVARHRANLPKETIGVGEGFDFQLFDSTLLYSAQTRFVLAGIVNRMDRTYAAEASCGEIRLIYRLTRINKSVGDDAPPPRHVRSLCRRSRSGARSCRCHSQAGWPLGGRDQQRPDRRALTGQHMNRKAFHGDVKRLFP